MINNDQCIMYNGYNFFYSNENDNYYIITDYICNKSLIETQKFLKLLKLKRILIVL